MRTLLPKLSAGAALALCLPALAADYDGDGLDDLALYTPGTPALTMPLLLSDGEGSWALQHRASPPEASEPGVIALPGDYDGDGRADVALHRPGAWETVSVLLSDGEAWSEVREPVPSWANEAGVIAVPGDYDGDGTTDLALHKPGSDWAELPVLLSDGGGGWQAIEAPVPTWAHAGGSVVPGDYDGDGTTDLALHRTDPGAEAMSVLLSDGGGGWQAIEAPTPAGALAPGAQVVPGDYDGDGITELALHQPGGEGAGVSLLRWDGGGWTERAMAAPSWASEAGAIAVAGDYDGDGDTDLAFHQPGGEWSEVPVLLSDGGEAWKAVAVDAPAWAHDPRAVALVGDYDGDGLQDLAFHDPDDAENPAPILYSRMHEGEWSGAYTIRPAWAELIDAELIAVPHVLRLRPRIVDGGDASYDRSDAEQDQFQDDFSDAVAPLAISDGGDITIVIPQASYDALQDTLGFTGTYDGTVYAGSTTASAVLILRDHGGEAHGTVTLTSETLELDAGFGCGGEETLPISTFPVHLSTSVATPSLVTVRSEFSASGSTSRQVSRWGLFSGTATLDFELDLYNLHGVGVSSDTWIFGSLDIYAPGSCNDQHLSVFFERRNHTLFEAFGY